MVLREPDKHLLLSLLAATGIILFWRGMWEVADMLPVISHPLASLVTGLVILAFSGIIFKEFDPLGGIEKSSLNVIHNIHTHPKKHEFTIRYYDKAKKEEVDISAKNIKSIEKNNIEIHIGRKEIIIPIHRVRSVHRNGHIVWRL